MREQILLDKEHVLSDLEQVVKTYKQQLESAQARTCDAEQSSKVSELSSNERQGKMEAIVDDLVSICVHNTATHCNTLQHMAGRDTAHSYCNIQFTAALGNTRQHTAKHGSTRQHCNTL